MKLWIAQGFGVGRIPIAPGTFGSIIGLAWFALLLCAHSWLVFVLGNLAGIVLSIWLCGEAERTLRRTDPRSVVLDELIAIPLCFLSWLVPLYYASHRWPTVAYFCKHWFAVLIVFALFRLFDVTKPWPVRQSQVLHGGWGVTVDDLLAAVYVNLAVLLLRFIPFSGLLW